MALLKYFSCDRSVPKQSSFLTQKEKEVASNLVSKVEQEVQPVGVTLYIQSKCDTEFHKEKNSDFLMKPHKIIPANITRHTIVQICRNI